MTDRTRPQSSMQEELLKSERQGLIVKLQYLDRGHESVVNRIAEGRRLLSLLRDTAEIAALVAGILPQWHSTCQEAVAMLDVTVPIVELMATALDELDMEHTIIDFTILDIGSRIEGIEAELRLHAEARMAAA
ncbi:MAG: hypothetical protein Q7S02_02635 [bacterium]|nr:hypothetical protein [bacterium]